jgi:hypothetical protein
LGSATTHLGVEERIGNRYLAAMPRFDTQSTRDLDTQDIADTILNAPVTVRLGLVVRNERLRERSAIELATMIVEHRAPAIDTDQLPLPL